MLSQLELASLNMIGLASLNMVVDRLVHMHVGTDCSRLDERTDLNVVGTIMTGKILFPTVVIM